MKMPSAKNAIAAVALGWLSTVSVSQAAVMVSNLSEPTYAYFPVGFWWAGNQFITDNSASAFSLDSVTLKMQAADPLPPGSFFVAVYSHATDRPGNLLQTLTGSADPSTAGDYTYTSTGFNLAPNTSYWIVAGVSSGGSPGAGYHWTNGDLTFDYTGPWTIPTTDTHITSYDSGGSTWNNEINNGYPRQFSVAATTVVPEPSSIALVIGGTALLVWRRRARVRS